MTTSAIRKLAKDALYYLESLETEMSDQKLALEDEQDQSEKEAEEWDEEAGDPEPEIVDHQQEIDLLGEQLFDLKTIISGMELIVSAVR